jgi:hypothetical protein
MRTGHGAEEVLMMCYIGLIVNGLPGRYLELS